MRDQVVTFVFESHHHRDYHLKVILDFFNHNDGTPNSISLSFKGNFSWKVSRVAAVMQEFTQSGGVRPFGVSLLICGWDKDAPEGENDPKDGNNKAAGGRPRLFQVKSICQPFTSYQRDFIFQIEELNIQFIV